MSTKELTVMTANLAGARRQKQGRLDPKQTAFDFIHLMKDCSESPIREHLIDSIIIAIQETYVVWTGFAGLPGNTARTLAENFGLQDFFAPYLDSDSQPHKNKWERKAFEGFRKLQQGNAIVTNLRLGKWPWMQTNVKSPMNIPISHPMLFSTGNRDTEPRHVVFIPLIIGNRLIYFMAIHLTTLSGEDRHDPANERSKIASITRLEQIGNIHRLLYELRNAEKTAQMPHAPVILAGDFNATPESPEIINLSFGDIDRFKRVQTLWHCSPQDASLEVLYTHIGHKTCVDHIFYSDPDDTLKVQSGIIFNEPGTENITDHYPVIAKFLIEQA